MHSLLQDSVLTPRELAAAYRDPSVREILASTPSLASVDLSRLNSLTKQMVFFTNVLNTLYAHALMYCFANVGERDMALSEASEGFSLRGHGISTSAIESDRVLQTALFTKVGYHVGQLGLISCHDLHHSFLRQGLAPPTIIKDTKLKLRLPLTQPDPWLDYTPSPPDPRLFYVIHDGLMESPHPIPLSVETFETSLSSAERRYLNSTVSIDAAKREVSVPRPLINNRNDFRSRKVSPQGESPLHTDSQARQSEQTFFRYIQSNMDTKADILLTLIESCESAKSSRRLSLVVVQPENTKLGYNFSHHHQLSASTVVSPIGSPKSRRKRPSRDLSRRDVLSPASDAESGPRTGRCAFTAETLDFVSKRAPLLASLVSLVCPIEGVAKVCADEAAGEEERDTSMAGDKEESRTSKRSRVTSPLGMLTPHTYAKMTGTFDDSELTPWKRQYNEVLTCFSSYLPLSKFLAARLHCFAEQISWEPPPSLDSLSLSPSRLQGPLSDASEGLSLRKIAVASASSKELAVACSYVMKKLVDSEQISEAVRFLSSEPAVSNLPEVQLLADMALSCYFVDYYHQKKKKLSLSRGNGGGDGGEDDNDRMITVNPVSTLSRLSDPELAARLALASLQKWPVDVCVDMLSYCLHHLPLGSCLATPLSSKLERLRVYSQIMSKCESPISYQWSRTRAPWMTWAELAKDSKNKTNYVLRVLLESKEFELSREWCRVHKLSGHVQQQIEVDYLFELLEGGTPNPILAHQVRR